MNIEERALDVLESQGWTKGVSLHPMTGEMCLDGALIVAAGMDWVDVHLAGADCCDKRHPIWLWKNPDHDPARRDEYEKAAHRVCLAIAKYRDLHTDGSPSFRIPSYNDLPSTTYEDVVLVLKHAAAMPHDEDPAA